MSVRESICAIHWPIVPTILEAMTAPAAKGTLVMASLAVQVSMHQGEHCKPM